MNIKNTLRVLALCVSSLVSGMAYGQTITNTWVGEEWSNPTSGSYNYYIKEKSTNHFLMHESTTTTNPNDATMFSIADHQISSASPWHKYHVTYKYANETYYVAEINGSAIWGALQNEGGIITGFLADYDFKWHFEKEGTDTYPYYKIWNFDRKGGGIGNNFDPRWINLVDDANDATSKIVSYIEKGDYTQFHMISQAQYDALYPQRFIRESLNYDKIKCTGWYNPIGAATPSTDAYYTTSKVWMAKMATPANPSNNSSSGGRSKLTISNLTNRSYDIEFYVYSNRNGGNGTTYSDKESISIIGRETKKQFFTTENISKTGNTERCQTPDVVSFSEVYPNANGVIDITINVNGSVCVYAALKSITYHESSVTSSLEDGSFYIYNVGKGKYLESGNNWDSQASLGHGMLFNRIKSSNGKYYFQSRIKKNNSEEVGYLFSQNTTSTSPLNGNEYQTTSLEYVDGDYWSEYNISPTYTGSNKYKISLTRTDTHTYNKWEVYHNVEKTETRYPEFPLFVDPTTNTALSNNYYVSQDEYTQWQFQTYAQRLNDVKLATAANPKDATFFIGDPAFSSKHIDYDRWEKAEGTFEKNATGVMETNNNHLRCVSSTFDISQTLTDIPNGLYMLSAQGFHNDYRALNPIFELYASDIISDTETNDYATPLTNLSTENSQIKTVPDAYTLFKNGECQSKLLCVVTNGKLKIGARCYASDGDSRIDNFELTYYGPYNVNDVGDIDMFIKNPGFSKLTWDQSWEGHSTNIEKGTSNNTTFEGSGYYADASAEKGATIEAGNIFQDIELAAGAYKLSASVVALNNPGYLYAKIDDREQHIVFVDNADVTDKKSVYPKNRELIFVLPQASIVRIGYRFNSGTCSTGMIWNAIDNFHLQYLGKAQGTDISCQVVNSDFNKDNNGLDSKFGWQSLGTEYFSNNQKKYIKCFNYEDFGGNEYGIVQIYNGKEDVSQTITGIPNGWYEINVQGFYRDATTADKFKNRKGMFIIANNTFAQMQLINSVPSNKTKYPDKTNAAGKVLDKGGYPDDLSDALKAFNEDGSYKNNKLKVRVTDGKITINFRREENASTDGADWTVINYCKLKYLHNDSELSSEEEFSQYIKNPSFEAVKNATNSKGETLNCPEGWTTSSKVNILDNKNSSLMTGGDGRYIANTGDDMLNPKVSYYYLEQELGGVDDENSIMQNGLPQGTYALQATVTSSPNNVITMMINGRRGDKVVRSATNGEEITIGNIGINNNERFKIAFSSVYPFSIDNVRLHRSNRIQGDGDAVDVDLSGLLLKADTILESGFMGNGAFQINADELNDAIAEAKALTDDSNYAARFTAKTHLSDAIANIQDADINVPSASTDYMIQHIASDLFITTDNNNKVVLSGRPAKIRITQSEDGYIITDVRNSEISSDDVMINANGISNPLVADATNGVKVYFKVICTNGVPNHIAISTTSTFDDETCFGTINNNMASAPVYANTDKYDGNSQWIISNWQEPSIDVEEKFYLYNIEAGAFFGYNKDKTLFGWATKAVVNGDIDLPWSFVESGENTILKQTVTHNADKYLFIENDTKYGVSLWVDGPTNSNNHEFSLAKNDETGFYTIGINKNNSTYGIPGKQVESYIGWSGENKHQVILPLIPIAEKEPRGIHWKLCSPKQYQNMIVSTSAAHEARMNAWPVLRSALRSNIDASDFEVVYYNPLSTPTEISTAAEELKTLIVAKAKLATYDNPIDYSYMYDDLDCQQLTEDPAHPGERVQSFDGWSSISELQTQMKNNFDHYAQVSPTAVFGNVFYEFWDTQALTQMDLYKSFTNLPAGYYTIAADIKVNSEITSDPITGVQIFAYETARSTEINQAISNKDLKTITIGGESSGYNKSGTLQYEKMLRVPNGDGVAIYAGVKTISGTNATWVAFDNLKLLYCGPLRDISTTTDGNNTSTVKFTGTWRDTETTEISNAINEQRNTSKNEETATTVVDMKSAEIMNDIDITILNPNNTSEKNAGNTLIWAPVNAPVTVNGIDQNVIKGGLCTSFLVTDGQTLYIPTGFTANNVKYTRKVSATNEYGTIILPYEIKTDENLQLYTLYNAGENGSFNIERVNTLPAGTPGFYRKINPEATSISFNRTNGSYSVTTTTGDLTFESTDTQDNFKIVGSYVYGTIIGDKNYADTHKNDASKPSDWGTKANKYYYIKSNQFYQGFNYFYNDAFRAYIDGTDAPTNLAREIFSLTEWEMPNEIDDIVAVKEAEIIGIYTSNGTKIDDLKPGVNIIKYSNGKVKKVFIK